MVLGDWDLRRFLGIHLGAGLEDGGSDFSLLGI